MKIVGSLAALGAAALVLGSLSRPRTRRWFLGHEAGSADAVAEAAHRAALEFERVLEAATP
jgi:hypothetical protein